VIRRAAELSPLDFIVTEGLRTRERQAQLVKAGASQTMNSKHLIGRAVDLAAVVDGEVRWDWNLYLRLAETVGQAAKELDTKLVWGGTWQPLEARPYSASELSKRFPDGPHFQLADTGMA
jgi:peptidoglycan L-alanyl-D-glutamate endopeptidase CwlK